MAPPPSANNDEDNRFSHRVKRYARVGAAGSNLAARLVGKRLLGTALSNSIDPHDIKTILGSLKGPLMKVAQILATFPDVLPEDYARELRELQANAPAMGWLFVKRRMRTELGSAWQGKFKHFSQQAAAAASLGQVHHAVALNGDQLACKLQYPDMTSVVEADLSQLRLALGLYWRVSKTVDTSAVFNEIAQRMREELNYTLEAKHIALYQHMLRQEKNIHIPKLYPQLSTQRLLTMSRMDGHSLLTAKNRPEDERQNIALNMFHAWYAPFYNYGVIHGDPHLGNYTVRDDNGINLLDFGCVRVFPPRFVKGVIDLYWALHNNDRDMAAAAYESWGFSNLDHNLIETLNLWAKFVYAPLMEDRTHLMRETNSAHAGTQAAGQVRERLRALGGIKLPREFVLMDRAALGLGSVFLHLATPLNWHRLFHNLIRDFDVTKLASNQAKALKKAGITASEADKDL